MEYRISGTIAISSIGVGLIGVHYFTKLWPALPAAIALGTVLLTFASHHFQSSPAWLLGACILMMGHTLIALLYPETLSVIDPDSYAVFINQVIKSGDVSQAGNQTYSALSQFLLLISAVSEVTALAPRNSFVTIPILISIIVPIFTAWFTAVLTGCNWKEWPAVPASLFSSVLTMNIVSSYRPIAMTVGYLLLLLAFIVSIRFFRSKNNADLVVFVVLVVGLTFSHRFTILLLALGVLAQGIALTALRPQREFFDSVALLAIAGTFLILQWMYITSGLSKSIYQILSLFAEPVGPVADVSADKLQIGASKPIIESRILGIITRRAHGLILIPIAGLSWIYFTIIECKNPRDSVLSALAMAAAIGLFLPLSVVFPDLVNYTRTVSIAEPTLLSLAVGCGWLLWQHLNSRSRIIIKFSKTILVFIIGVLIVAQVSSVPISADHPASYRGYLQDDEATAKLWGQQYLNTGVAADPFLAHEKPLPRMYVESDGGIKEEYQQRYRAILEAYTDQSIVSECPSGVLYRDIKIYASPRAQVLQWNPEPTLNTEYSRQYDAGKVQFFTEPRCQVS